MKIVLYACFFVLIIYGCSSKADRDAKDINIDSHSKQKSINDFFTISDTIHRVVRWKVSDMDNEKYDTIGFPLPNLNNSYIEWQNKEFVSLRSSCGSPCWHSYIFSKKAGQKAERYIYTVAFDTINNLVLYVPDEIDSSYMLRVGNFRDHNSFDIKRENCPSLMTFLCIDSAYFSNAAVTILWDTTFVPTSKKFSKIKIPF